MDRKKYLHGRKFEVEFPASGPKLIKLLVKLMENPTTKPIIRIRKKDRHIVF